MANVRSQRAAITAVLSIRPSIVFEKEARVLSVVRARNGRLLPVAVAGISQGDAKCLRLKTTEVAVLRLQKPGTRPKIITIKADSACVLMERASRGPGNQLCITALTPVQGRNGALGFQKIGKPEIYSDNV